MGTDNRALALARLIGAAVVLSAIVLIFVMGPEDEPRIYSLGFFTVQSNIMVVAWWIMAGIAGLKGGSQALHPSYQAAVSLNIVATGLIFHIFLSGIYSPEGIRAYNDLVTHTLAPLVFFIDWLITQPPGAYTLRHYGSWLSYPAAYTIFAIVEGSIIGQFRYPFFDYRGKTLGQFMLTFAFVAAFFIVLGLVFWGQNRLRGRRSQNR